MGRSLQAIEGEASRLETMVSDLLDLAKIDAHTFRVELEEIDPAEVLEQTSVINDTVGERPLVVFWKAGTNSALLHHEYFWFAWAAFRPHTVVYGD